MAHDAKTVRRFRSVVWAHYKKHGRHDLPWRHTRNLYNILVSEVMLQQTQVERVIPLYRAFLKRFPTARSLARAPLSDVLKAWQGLGYNRRAKMLHAAAKQLESSFGKSILILRYSAKSEYDAEIARQLKTLPGVGKYTARAVAVFAYGADEVLVETNIRTAVIRHFFSEPRSRGATMIYHSGISDAEIEKVLMRARPPGGRARQWNYALMDYGAFLKRSGVRLNAKSKHYAKQSRFAGSMREARGAILRELARGSNTSPRLLGLLGDERRDQLEAALAALRREQLVIKKRVRYALRD